MFGYKERVNVAPQMNKSITTKRDEKSNKALMFDQWFSRY